MRAVVEAMNGSGVPVAILPAGTGNLLARNLGIPLDEVSALRTALEGRTRPIDLVRAGAAAIWASGHAIYGFRVPEQLYADPFHRP